MRSCPFKALDEALKDTVKSFSEIHLDYMNWITFAFCSPYHCHWEFGFVTDSFIARIIESQNMFEVNFDRSNSFIHVQLAVCLDACLQS